MSGIAAEVSPLAVFDARLLCAGRRPYASVLGAVWPGCGQRDGSGRHLDSYIATPAAPVVPLLAG